MARSFKIIENEVTRRFGRDSSVRFIGSEDAVTGGKTILVDITGVVMAFDEADAIKRVQMIVGEIAKNNGYDLTGFQDMSKHHGIEVKSAPRNTIDYVQENSGMPVKFKVRVKFLVK